jgi:hypothetical protein
MSQAWCRTAPLRCIARCRLLDAGQRNTLLSLVFSPRSCNTLSHFVGLEKITARRLVARAGSGVVLKTQSWPPLGSSGVTLTMMPQRA